MKFVLRQISPPGKSALADEATAVALTIATVQGTVQLGKYLEWSDPDGRGGMGDERWTDDVTKAKTFPTFADAMECWKAESSIRPVRPDGRPNRPLTAFSITVEKVE